VPNYYSTSRVQDSTTPLNKQYPLLPAIAPSLPTSPSNKLNLEMQTASSAGVTGMGTQGSTNTRLFLRRLTHLREKMDKDLEFVTISRDKMHD